METEIGSEQNFSKEYFERISKGEESMLFLRLGSDIDLPIIQSLLFSENIPSFSLNQHSAKLLGGGWNVVNPAKIELYILKSDYETALELLRGFSREYRGTLIFYNKNGESVPVDVSKKETGRLSNSCSLLIIIAAILSFLFFSHL